MKIEICVDSVEGAMAAERGGAARVELCDNLFEGGTTPSAGALRQTRRAVSIGLHVLVRPRGGDFLYSESEFAVMEDDIRLAGEWGADGVVVGCLTSEGDIDLKGLRRLQAAAGTMDVTFHRAFDMARDPRRSLEQLIDAGVGRLLTSGREASCLEGMELISELHAQAAGRLVVVPGGGITARNVARLVAGTGVEEVHLSARTSMASGMRYRNEHCFMGGALRPPEFGRKVTDASVVAEVVRLAGGGQK